MYCYECSQAGTRGEAIGLAITALSPSVNNTAL